jgi:hypothetical protein
LRFGEISSALVAFLMLMASSWSVLHNHELAVRFSGAAVIHELGMLHAAHGSHDC